MFGLGGIWIFGVKIILGPFGLVDITSQGPFCTSPKVGGPDLTNFQNTSQG